MRRMSRRVRGPTSTASTVARSSPARLRRATEQNGRLTKALESLAGFGASEGVDEDVGTRVINFPEDDDEKEFSSVGRHRSRARLRRYDQGAIAADARGGGADATRLRPRARRGDGY